MRGRGGPRLHARASGRVDAGDDGAGAGAVAPAVVWRGGAAGARWKRPDPPEAQASGQSPGAVRSRARMMGRRRSLEPSVRPLCLKTRTSVLPFVPLLFGGLSDTIRCLHLVQYWALPTGRVLPLMVSELRCPDWFAFFLIFRCFCTCCLRSFSAAAAGCAGLSSHRGCIDRVEKAHRELQFAWRRSQTAEIRCSRNALSALRISRGLALLSEIRLQIIASGNG